MMCLVVLLMTYGGRLLVCAADATLNILSDTLKDTALSLSFSTITLTL